MAMRYYLTQHPGKVAVDQTGGVGGGGCVGNAFGVCRVVKSVNPSKSEPKSGARAKSQNKSQTPWLVGSCWLTDWLIRHSWVHRLPPL